MKILSVLGKYLDQPKLVGNFSKAVPALLIAGGVAYAIKNVYETPEKERHKELIKSAAVLTGTIGSALVATRGIKPFKIGKKVFKGFEGLSERIDLKEIKQEQTELINDFLENNKDLSKNATDFLQIAKEKVLSLSQIKTVFEELEKKQGGKEFLEKFVPNPENVDSKEIFGEIKRLSIIGLVPVLGGIAGGIFGDKLTEDNWKDRIPDKIKEGSYQYLANIFLCNVGAGAALAVMEKANIKSKAARAGGMIAGIILAGLVFGSAIANLIGNICIDPLLHHKDKNHPHNHKGLYEERTPEALDLGLHVDDVATVAVLSGLRWIEPALPILYSISGYRAGIGYRNGEHDKK